MIARCRHYLFVIAQKLAARQIAVVTLITQPQGEERGSKEKGQNKNNENKHKLTITRRIEKGTIVQQGYCFLNYGIFGRDKARL